MSEAQITLTVAIVFGVISSLISWRALKHNVGSAAVADVRSQLRDCRSEIATLREEHADCQESLLDMRAKYEAELERHQRENLYLLRKLVGLET